MSVEAAIALSAAVLLLALCLSGIACAIAQIRCVDVAGEAARLAARGDQQAARAVVQQLAPDGAVLQLRIDDDRVVATVSARPAGLLPVTVRASAIAASQDAVGAAGWQAAGSDVDGVR